MKEPGVFVQYEQFHKMVVRRQDNLVFVLKIQLGIIKSSSNSKNYFLINK